MSRHSGTVALVTGAGHGIGRAIALQLAREGAAVTVAEINEDWGRETVELLKAAGARTHFVKADITNFAEVEAAFADATAALGPISLLVNNAAFTDAGNLADIALDGWHKEIDVNLNGTYHCIRAILPLMRAQGGGAIVNISSVNATRYFGNPSYSAAKAGIISLTQSVASEFGRDGIRCNAVCPGSVRTDNITWTTRQQKDPQVFQKLARWYPLGRVAEPEDIANAVAFLGSDQAGYITGAVLPVDGGLLAGMNVMIDEFILESRND
ncbi:MULTISPECIES: glucose 1-dehydrogenase [unclassified Mesorhizobium]|uniref:SDR family NAD(P)-dependent oxidoreductase n=1 Tax=unclassified Mesorhizobium TaxID=325217 RepID=UPI000FDC4837|nr:MULTISPECIES: glucose 1-dehydrogenase [unclassified Mesorhizobium]TGQ39438.1 glucose 1-dehydrogenase [Mesorhizobium sp. M00.F.Ca.ET.216.01.1.1]TIS57510.1 MAG: glucose 1-dehydrogenase [Mesorhizobium sp.]TIS91864.1 MAG: glucose 1-dehydrogenase [Mesorhizobium sp.]TJW11702.1 MAG: glucose 1-dehydrogenase [Mesorhizobium sp.]TJW42222.1 MAG: glucose 1-dehydrogenase [Mesorhizobium sp.]